MSQAAFSVQQTGSGGNSPTGCPSFLVNAEGTRGAAPTITCMCWSEIHQFRWRL